MKSEWKVSPFLRIFAFLSVLMAVIVIAAIGMYYYVFSIPEPEGLSLASWPSTFTDNFYLWMEYADGTVRVRETGLERLDEYGLWLQVLDETGQEVFSYRKPEDFPADYGAPELTAIPESDYENGYTVFAGGFQDSGKAWSYLIGFPYAIGKYMLYYNGENVARLSPVAGGVLLFALGTLALLALGYGLWIIRRLGEITGGIESISRRAYRPLKEAGMFRDIYRALNQMDDEIQCSDRVRSETDTARNEWIANVTHDLKTPLSPIKGYAELLADAPAAEIQSVREYGAIILKNINHAEKLINDLKLTYQLHSGAIPYYPQEVRLTRFLKEVVIDIVNDPAFSHRDIEFESGLPERAVFLDPALFRRAVANLVINALVHNPPETMVAITVVSAPGGGVLILIRDNGRGISEAEQAELFTRYYRGTGTGERPEGTGLGLAIAKQIVQLHGGDVTVQSSPGRGTEFAILLPL